MNKIAFGESSGNEVLEKDRLNALVEKAEDWFLRHPVHCPECNNLNYEPSFIEGSFMASCDCWPAHWKWVEIQDLKNRMRELAWYE